MKRSLVGMPSARVSSPGRVAALLIGSLPVALGLLVGVLLVLVLVLGLLVGVLLVLVPGLLVEALLLLPIEREYPAGT